MRRRPPVLRFVIILDRFDSNFELEADQQTNKRDAFHNHNQTRSPSLRPFLPSFLRSFLTSSMHLAFAAALLLWYCSTTMYSSSEATVEEEEEEGAV